MKWIIPVLVFLVICACNDSKPVTKVDASGSDFQDFKGKFAKADVGYHLSDTELLQIRDTTTISSDAFEAGVPDSLKLKMLGRLSPIKYTPLAVLESKGAETYFVMKLASTARAAALLVSFDKNNQFGAAFPFLIPDNDPRTTQVSTIDKSYSLSRSVSHKGKDETVTEGKDVYAYNAESKNFTLIMTDLLNDTTLELFNPIDTFSSKRPFTGDYGTNKRNIVSIRDGRDDKELNFYIHFEEDGGECKGELKGTAFFTSSKTAVYRQGGEACVLELQFNASSVTLREAEGCGLYRGLKCSFDGTYKKKKPLKKGLGDKKTGK